MTPWYFTPLYRYKVTIDSNTSFLIFPNMPKKLTFERDLVDVKITRKCHTYLLTCKQHGQPIYSVIDHIVGAYRGDSEARHWQELYNDAIDAGKRRLEKIMELEAKIEKIQDAQRQLVEYMK